MGHQTKSFCTATEIIFQLTEKEKWSEVKSLSRVRLFDPTDCSLPGSSVHGILQAKILEWVAVSSYRGSSQPRDWTQVSCIAGRFFIIWGKPFPPGKSPWIREDIYK